MTDTGLEIARKVVGGKSADLARLLGITESAISQWNGIVPPKRAIEIEEKTGGKVTRYEIRPDYFGIGAVAAEASTEAASAVPGEAA